MPAVAKSMVDIKFSPGETIIFQVRQAIIVLILQLLGLALIAFVVIMLLLAVTTLGDLPTIGGLNFASAIILFVLIAVGFVALVRILDYLTTTYTVTNLRVQRDFGIFSRTSFSIPIAEISDVDVKQSFFGLLFNYGDINVRSDSSVHNLLVFNVIASPEARRDDIALH
jgi:uncharacterized membrane protein YdbT with pleckstrin-like domain